MRDERGRYHATKAIAESVPGWANGCPQCKGGIVSAPELTGATSLYLERLVQAIDGDIVFCTCRAGMAYRSSLLNRHRSLVEEAKRDTRMQESAGRRSHPDIENARVAMQAAAGQSGHMPTIHLEPSPTPTLQAELTPERELA